MNYLYRFGLFFSFCINMFAIIPIKAQYDGAAGTAGSLAVYKNSFNLQIWANVCQSQLGFQDISRPNLGLVNSGSDFDACGRAGDGRVLSLGDRGQAILSFAQPLTDGAGYDLVVFENSFSDTFLELAFVEISSDGQNFFRFAAVSLSDTSGQIATFGATYPENLHNLAGKYRANYGVGFDFAELGGNANLDLQNVGWVKIIAVTGSINPAFADRDSRGTMINEPFPTPFNTGGFDLDAVAGVYPQNNTSTITENFHKLNQKPYTGAYSPEREQIKIFLNPVFINNDAFLSEMSFGLYNLSGQMLETGKFSPTSETILPVQPLVAGIYYLSLYQNAELIQTLTFTTN